MLCAIHDRVRVIASSSLIRDAKYFCPLCSSPVVLKAGHFKIAHFAHYANSSCDAASESKKHLLMKHLILGAAHSSGLIAEPELVIGDHRTDVAIRYPNGKRLAVEVQLSSIDVPEIHARMRSYTDNKYATLWVSETPIDPCPRTSGGVRVPKWKSYLSTLTKSKRIFNFSNGLLVPVTLDRAVRWREEAYNSCGELVGGYWDKLTDTFNTEEDTPFSIKEVKVLLNKRHNTYIADV